MAHTLNKKPKTQAFRDASVELNRSLSACGYRWNKVLSHKNWVNEQMLKKLKT